MTLAPATLARSAVELRNDDGQPVATIYATSGGLEIVCQQGWSAEYSHDRQTLIQHLGVTFTAAAEERRR
ncbi:MAG: hypothetical protein ABSC05_35935 [Candidatus Solibacter sp.]|jgi:hypothetical protein